MEITLKELDQRGTGMMKLLESPFDIAISWRLKPLAKAVVENLREMGEYRQKAIRKYSVPSDEGQVRVPPNKLPEFEAEWEDFISKTVTLPDETVSLEEVKKFAKLNSVELAQADILISNK
jgi:hypothetical protein